MYRDTTNVQHEVDDCTSNNWSQWNGNKRFKKFGSHKSKIFGILTTKTAILGTSHTIRNVLQSETLSLSGGDHRWFKRSSRKKRPVTRDNNNNNNNTIIIIITKSIPS